MCILGRKFVKFFEKMLKFSVGIFGLFLGETQTHFKNFLIFLKMKKSSGWYYTLYRIKNFLSVLHLDDLEWSRSRETKNSYHKWIHMATTNEVHCSTFNFLLISEKSYFRISLKNVFLTSLIIIKLHQSYQRKWAVNGWSGPSKMIQMVHWLEEVNE